MSAPTITTKKKKKYKLLDYITITSLAYKTKCASYSIELFYCE